MFKKQYYKEEIDTTTLEESVEVEPLSDWTQRLQNEDWKSQKGDIVRMGRISDIY